MERYCAAMEQIKVRIAAAEHSLGQGIVHPNVESACLQVRLSLETLMLSSLLTNREAVAALSSAYAKKDHDAALKLVRNVNVNFWPRPSTQHPSTNGGLLRLEWVETGFLREEDYSTTWGALSEWCHATNPYRSERDLAAGAALVRDVATRLVILLNHHHRTLVDPNFEVICMMAAEDGRVHATIFGRQGPDSDYAKAPDRGQPSD